MGIVRKLLLPFPEDFSRPYITELDEELLHTLIDKIVVHEKELDDDGVVVMMKVDIYYRFIGKVGNMNGEDLMVSSGHWTPDLVKLPVQAEAAPA